ATLAPHLRPPRSPYTTLFRSPLPRREARRDAGRDADAARHHHEAARDLLAPPAALLEQEVVDDVDAPRREGRVERVLGVLVHPRLDGADAVVVVGRAGGDLLRE